MTVRFFASLLCLVTAVVVVLPSAAFAGPLKSSRLTSQKLVVPPVRPVKLKPSVLKPQHVRAKPLKSAVLKRAPLKPAKTITPKIKPAPLKRKKLK